MSQSKIVNPFAQSTDCLDTTIRNIFTFCEYKIPQPWSYGDDFYDSFVRNKLTIGEVNNPKAFNSVIGNAIKRIIRHMLAEGKMQFTDLPQIGEEVNHGLVRYLYAPLKVDFQEIWAVFGQGYHGVIGDKFTIIEF